MSSRERIGPRAEWLPRVLTMRVRIPLIAEKENGLSGRIIATVELPGEVFMKLVIVSIPFHFTIPRRGIVCVSKLTMVPLSLSLSLSSRATRIRRPLEGQRLLLQSRFWTSNNSSQISASHFQKGRDISWDRNIS